MSIGPDPLLGYVTQETWRKDFAPKLKHKAYMEANCAQCHTDGTFAGISTVERGRKLFFDTNCYGCHRIEGLSDGTLGPDLSETGKKFKLDYLWESIIEPRANSATSFMPKFNLNEDDVRALVVFLKSRKGRNFAETDIARFRTKLTGGAELGAGQREARRSETRRGTRHRRKADPSIAPVPPATSWAPAMEASRLISVTKDWSNRPSGSRIISGIRAPPCPIPSCRPSGSPIRNLAP